MPRIQVLPLPEGASDERPPYILIIDQADEGLLHDLAPNPEDDVKTDAQAALAESVGARAILCFRTTMDIPANDTSAYAQPTMTVRIEGDVDSGSAELADQISRGIERANATYGRSG